MYVYVNEARCKGCGVCLRICPRAAITLEKGVARDPVAHIDAEACDACGACIEACPEGAILSVSEPAAVESVSIARAPSASVLARRERQVPALVAVGRKLAPWAGAALAFLGREIAPRVVSSLLSAWDERLEGRSAGSQSREGTDLPASQLVSRSVSQSASQSAGPGGRRVRARRGRR